MSEIRVRLTFIEGMLGTSSNNKEVYRDFIASKAPDAESAEEEIARIGVDEFAEKGMTVFPRTDEGQPFLWDYQIRGFFKDACGMLRRVAGKDPETGKKKAAVNASGKLTSYKKDIDGLIFVDPRIIPIKFDGEIGVCQRPLRAQTAQGERIALAMSEEVPAGATIEFTVELYSDEHEKAVREWLNYGFRRGIGQWRNSGKGKFVWEELDKDGNVIGGNYEKKSTYKATA